ncbi:MAG: electron transfer flavoprotein subunit alpha/FixB family protein [Actinomycetota bacterium]|jgi:electron transfer flavoprotein alpha subunit
MTLSKIWVVAEAAGGKPSSLTLELLTRARALAGTVEAFYAGPDGAALAPTLGDHGAATLFTVDPGDRLVGAPAAATLAGLAAQHQPDAILFGATYDGRDIAARLSARLDRPVLANGTSLDTDGDQLTVGTAIFGGNTLVDTALRGPKPHLGLFRPKSFPAEPAGGDPAAVVEVHVADAGRAGETRLLDRFVQEQDGPSLEDAPVVVSGGRGLGAADHYAMVESLATLLKGAAGASRAIVDAGWVPYSHQIGQTGKTVKPRLYIACGISGATQHLVGMKGSERILAINKDPEAPIFSIADLGIVGDVHTVVPKVIEALHARL